MDIMEIIQNGSKRKINSYFRARDCSWLWPVCNKYNATERAIRKLRRNSLGCISNGGLEYFLALDAEISSIINSSI